MNPILPHPEQKPLLEDLNTICNELDDVGERDQSYNLPPDLKPEVLLTLKIIITNARVAGIAWKQQEEPAP